MKNTNRNNQEPQKVEIKIYRTKKSVPRIGTTRMIMRLALGSVIIGREELKNRFQEKQSVPHVPAATLNKEAPVESEADRVKYAVIGAMAKSSDTLRERTSGLERVSNRTYSRFSRAVEPVTNSKLFKPLRRRYQRFVDQGEQVVSEWIAAGRKEEYLSRQLVQETTIEAIEGTLDYLAESPELDELMQEQSADYVEDFIDGIQENATNTTVILSNWFTSTILRRPRHKHKSDAEQSSVSPQDSSDQEPGQS